MKSEKSKMLAGELYNPADLDLISERRRCRSLWIQLSDHADTSSEDYLSILDSLFGCPTNATVESPFCCDYGYNIHLGKNVHINYNCVFLDVNRITLGNDVFIGPAVQIYTATHPLDSAPRSEGLESSAPVTIGNNVWIGGGAILCPGVSIGDNSVIGAGSVVTRSIPSNVLAVGNPCRVLREIK